MLTPLQSWDVHIPHHAAVHSYMRTNKRHHRERKQLRVRCKSHFQVSPLPDDSKDSGSQAFKGTHHCKRNGGGSCQKSPSSTAPFPVSWTLCWLAPRWKNSQAMHPSRKYLSLVLPWRGMTKPESCCLDLKMMLICRFPLEPSRAALPLQTDLPHLATSPHSDGGQAWHQG